MALNAGVDRSDRRAGGAGRPCIVCCHRFPAARTLSLRPPVLGRQGQRTHFMGRFPSRQSELYLLNYFPTRNSKLHKATFSDLQY